MMLLNNESLRDVIAFPKVQNASCLMMDTPSRVSADQLQLLRIREDAAFSETFESELLGGVTLLRAMGERLAEQWPEGQLYRPAARERGEPQELVFIPYYAWANRGEGEMRVWLRRG